MGITLLVGIVTEITQLIGKPIAAVMVREIVITING